MNLRTDSEFIAPVFVSVLSLLYLDPLVCGRLHFIIFHFRYVKGPGVSYYVEGNLIVKSVSTQ